MPTNESLARNCECLLTKKKKMWSKKFKEWRSGEKKLIFMRASDNILVWKLVYYILKSDNGIPTLFNAYCLCQFIQVSKKWRNEMKKVRWRKTFKKTIIAIIVINVKRNVRNWREKQNKKKCVQVPENCVGKSMQIKEKPKRPINQYHCFPSTHRHSIM